MRACRTRVLAIIDDARGVRGVSGRLRRSTGIPGPCHRGAAGPRTRQLGQVPRVTENSMVLFCTAVVRNRRHNADSSFQAWSPHCQTSLAPRGRQRVILDTTVRRVWMRMRTGWNTFLFFPKTFLFRRGQMAWPAPGET